MDINSNHQQWSYVANDYVTIHTETHSSPYIECSRCGKILKKFYVVQDSDGVEVAYLGSCCIKKFS